jgi:hypothetical protein
MIMSSVIFMSFIKRRHKKAKKTTQKLTKTEPLKAPSKMGRPNLNKPAKPFQLCLD